MVISVVVCFVMYSTGLFGMSSPMLKYPPGLGNSDKVQAEKRQLGAELKNIQKDIQKERKNIRSEQKSEYGGGSIEKNLKRMEGLEQAERTTKKMIKEKNEELAIQEREEKLGRALQKEERLSQKHRELEEVVGKGGVKGRKVLR
jgi:Skp family chaperone for outer membrane proteins